MRMQLSSRATFFAKFFPAVWLMLPTSLAVLLLVRWDPGFFIAAGFVVVCFTLFWFTSFQLKAVIATDQGLSVSNYVEVVLIPYSQVAHVSCSFFNRQRVTLTLKSPCRFGSQIVFVPYTYFTFFGMREHPVVEFLRARCG